MAYCAKCGSELPAGANACPNCGTPTNGSLNVVTAEWDHTAEFDAKDISDNKVIAMLCYLTGIVGIFIALLGANKSDYAGFHVRQALKFTVIETLSGIIALLLCWTVIVPIAVVIWILVLAVVRIICFFSICNGEAKEPPIIRAFGFLK